MRRSGHCLLTLLLLALLAACGQGAETPAPIPLDGDQAEAHELVENDEAAAEAETEMPDGDSEREGEAEAEPEAEREDEAELPLLCGVPKSPSPVVDETAVWSAGESPTWVLRPLLESAELVPCDASVTKDSPNFTYASAISGDAQGAIWFANPYGLWKYTTTPTPQVSCKAAFTQRVIAMTMGAAADEVWLAFGAGSSEWIFTSTIAHFQNGSLLYEALPAALIKRNADATEVDGAVLALAAKGPLLEIGRAACRERV